MSDSKVKKRESNKKAAKRCRDKKRLYVESLEEMVDIVSQILNDNNYDNDHLVNDLRLIMKRIKKHKRYTGKRGRPRKMVCEEEDEDDDDEEEFEEEEIEDELGNRNPHIVTNMLSFIV